MRLAVRRPAQVLAVVEELRDLHPALRGRFTWRLAQRVLADAGIVVRLHRMRARARVISLGDATVITINPDQPARWHAGLAAHEWGHVVLHSEAGTVRQVAPCYRGDARELEAKLFARLLVGAHVELEHPDVAPLAARLERAAAQLLLPIDVAPKVSAPTARVVLPRGSQRPLRKPFPGSVIGFGASHDGLRLDWSRDGRPLHWFNYIAGWCEVWDVLVDPESGKREVVKVGSRGVTERVFVTTTAERKRYIFQEKEPRRRTVSALEEQFARAVRTKPAPRPAITPASFTVERTHR